MRHTSPKKPPLYGSYWANRFLKHHPKFSLCTKNPKKLKRQAVEDLIGLYKIIVGDIYNYNKIGIRLGAGKKEKVIIALKAFQITAIKNTSRESATVVEVISNNRAVGSPLIILAGKTI